MATSVELGPGTSPARPTRSRNSSGVSHWRRRTNSSSIIAMCAVGPPKAVVPRRRKASASSFSGTPRSRGTQACAEGQASRLRIGLSTSASRGSVPGRLEEKPRPPFGLVDPHLEQAGRRDIAVPLAGMVGFAHARDQAFVVLAELGEHVLRLDVVGVVVIDALLAGDVADGSDRG